MYPCPLLLAPGNLKSPHSVFNVDSNTGQAGHIIPRSLEGETEDRMCAWLVHLVPLPL